MHNSILLNAYYCVLFSIVYTVGSG